MDDIYITLTNTTSTTLYIGSQRNDLVVKANEGIMLSVTEYINYIKSSSSTKKILETYFQMKFDKEYEDIVLQIHNFARESIECYILLNHSLTQEQRNTLLLIKEMV